MILFFEVTVLSIVLKDEKSELVGGRSGSLLNPLEKIGCFDFGYDDRVRSRMGEVDHQPSCKIVFDTSDGLSCDDVLPVGFIEAVRVEL